VLFRNDDEDDCENNLESCDQILAINGILFDTTASIKFAYENLRVLKCEKSRKPLPIEILIARNVNKRLVRKNLKKPHLVLDKFVRAASSSSLSSLASISSLNRTPKSNNRRESGQILYSLDNDWLRVGSTIRQEENLDSKKVKTTTITTTKTTYN
jgi:hypothetical protein